MLRFKPQAGTVLPTVGWIDATVTLIAESLTVEVSELEALTQTVRGTHGDVYLVDFTFDSLRSRVRPVGGAWRAVTDTTARPVTGQAVVDERGRRSQFTLSDPGTVRIRNARRLRSFAYRLELPLPPDDGLVSPNVQWTADIVFPVDLSEGLSDVMPTPPLDLRGFATVAVDSIVYLGLDTLAYLRFDGILAPPEASDGLEAALRVTRLDASLAGSYVWSTGWSAYVSGATRLLLTATMLRPSSAGVLEGREIGLDALYRFQVRP